jgi:hypothetical protein
MSCRGLSTKKSLTVNQGVSLNTSQFFKHCKFVLPSGFAQGVEFRVGVGKKGSRAVKFYYVPLFKKHHLKLMITFSSYPDG